MLDGRQGPACTVTGSAGRGAAESEALFAGALFAGALFAGALFAGALFAGALFAGARRRPAPAAPGRRRGLPGVGRAGYRRAHRCLAA